MPASFSVWQIAHGGTAPTVNSVLPSGISAASSSAPRAVPQRDEREHGAEGGAARPLAPIAHVPPQTTLSITAGSFQPLWL